MVSRLRSINPVQMALVSGILYAIVGLVIGIFWVPISAMLAFAAAAMPGGHAGAFAGLGFLSIIVFPIMYFVIGFIGGLIWAVLYNLVAGWVGGVEITLDATAAPSSAIATV